MPALEARIIRNMLSREGERQCWDAFMAPVDSLDLFKEEQISYALDAVKAVEKIRRDSWDAARESFRARCRSLIRAYGPDLTRQEAQQARDEMFARFLEGENIREVID